MGKICCKHVCFLLAIVLSVNSFSGKSAKREETQAPLTPSMEAGQQLISEGKYQEAVQCFSSLLERFIEEGNRKKQMTCLSQLGLLYWNSGSLKESHEYYSEALLLAKAQSLWEDQKRFQSILEIFEFYWQGKDYRSIHEYSKSVQAFQNAIHTARHIHSPAHELKCLRQMAVTYYEMSDLRNVYLLSTQGLKLARALNNKREIVSALTNRGVYYSSIGNFSQALAHYFESLKIARDLNIQWEISTCLNNIAIDYKNIGSFQKALQLLSEALLIDRQMGDNDSVAAELNNVGTVFLSLAVLSGDRIEYYRALENFREALALCESMGGIKRTLQILNNIGYAYLELKEYQKTLLYLKEGLKRNERIHDLESQGMLLVNVGRVYFDLNDHVKAEEWLHKALQNAQEIEAGHILWEAYFFLGQNHEQKGEYSKAIDCYNRSIEVIENVREAIDLDINKAGYARDKVIVYEKLLNLLYFKYYLKSGLDGVGKEIFHVVERAKARTLLELLSSAQRGATGKPTNRASSDSLGPVPVDVIQQQLLDHNSAIAEYFLGDQVSFMLLISKNEFKVLTLPPRKEIRDSLKAYLKILSDPSKKRFQGTMASKRIYFELLSPAQGFLPESITHLIIIPDGILYYLPFETLKNEKGYLVSQYSISYMPSASSLFYLHEQKRSSVPRKDLLAFGNSDYEAQYSLSSTHSPFSKRVLKDIYQDKGFRFSPLPNSSAEVKAVSRFFPQTACDTFIDRQANEKTLKSTALEDYRIIHFACHSFLDEQDPLNSALVLSPSNGVEEDGFLQVHEIYDLRMRADLVVLSSCQTGKGKLEKGEGLLGLPKIFFYAGARSTLSTLWEIEDKAALKFMERFYSYLSLGKAKAQALQLAKLQMMRTRYSHPYYWAAFVLNGEHSSPVQ